MSFITKIEVETWTRNSPNAGTNDRIDAKITFNDGINYKTKHFTLEDDEFRY